MILISLASGAGGRAEQDSMTQCCSSHMGQPFCSTEHSKAESTCVRGKGGPKWVKETTHTCWVAALWSRQEQLALNQLIRWLPCMPKASPLVISAAKPAPKCAPHGEERTGGRRGGLTMHFSTCRLPAFSSSVSRGTRSPFFVALRSLSE